MARLMADHGIRLGLEFIGPKTLRDGMKYEFVHNFRSRCVPSGAPL